jgi:hypothetical protein
VARRVDGPNHQSESHRRPSTVDPIEIRQPANAQD